MKGPIPKPYAIETCKLGQMANCCRYLAADPSGLCCLKGTNLQPELDTRARNGTMNARGDNCIGWAALKPKPVLKEEKWLDA